MHSHLAVVALCLSGARCGSTDGFFDIIAAHPELSNISALLRSVPSSFLGDVGTEKETFCAPTNDAIAPYLNTTEGANLIHNQQDLQEFLQYHSFFRWTPSRTNAIIYTVLGYLSESAAFGAVVKYQEQSKSLLSGLGEVSAVGECFSVLDVGSFPSAVCEIDPALRLPVDVVATKNAIEIVRPVPLFGDPILLDDAGADNGSLTLFMPSNAAWLLSDVNADSLSATERQSLVMAHLVSGTVYYSVGGHAVNLTTQFGNMITVTPQTGGSPSDAAPETAGSSLGQTFRYVIADIPLSNDVLHIIDKVLDPFNTTAQASAPVASSSSSQASPSSSLSPGAKAGIGVGAAVVGLALALTVFLCYRRWQRHKTRSKDDLKMRPQASSEEYEKPELVSGPFDLRMAGPVRRKPELETRTEWDGERPMPARAEAEMAGTTLGAARIGSHELSNSRFIKQVDSSSSTAKQDSTVSRRTPRTTTSEPTNNMAPLENHDELTEEVDTLVSELGVISKRKKFLQAAAEAAKMKPEDVDGRKGEEYRELVLREGRVRTRMAEVHHALGGVGESP